MFYDKRGLRMEKAEVYVVMDQEEGRVTGQDERRNESSIPASDSGLLCLLQPPELSLISPGSAISPTWVIYISSGVRYQVTTIRFEFMLRCLVMRFPRNRLAHLSDRDSLVAALLRVAIGEIEVNNVAKKLVNSVELRTFPTCL